MRRAGLCESKLSVRLSFTRRYCIKMKTASIMISSPSESPNVPVFGNMQLIRKFERGHPKWGWFMRLGWVRTSKQCKIGPRLLLNTNRKSHTRFRLVPKSMTLDDPKLTLNNHYEVVQYACLSEPTTKMWMKIDPYYQQQKCRPKIGVSSNIRFMQIFVGNCRAGGVKWEWGRFLAIFDQYVTIISKTVHFRQSYYRMVIGNHRQSIEWCHFRCYCILWRRISQKHCEIEP